MCAPSQAPSRASAMRRKRWAVTVEVGTAQILPVAAYWNGRNCTEISQSRELRGNTRKKAVASMAVKVHLKRHAKKNSRRNRPERPKEPLFQMSLRDHRPRSNVGRGSGPLPVGNDARYARHVQGDVMHVAQRMDQPTYMQLLEDAWILKPASKRRPAGFVKHSELKAEEMRADHEGAAGVRRGLRVMSGPITVRRKPDTEILNPEPRTQTPRTENRWFTSPVRSIPRASAVAAARTPAVSI